MLTDTVSFTPKIRKKWEESEYSFRLAFYKQGKCSVLKIRVHLKFSALKTYNQIRKGRAKVIPQQADVAQGVSGRLRSRIFLTFSTTRVVGRQPYALAAFTPGEIPGTHFQRLSRPQGTWFCRKEPWKKIPSDTTGNRSRDRPTSSAVP